MGYVFSQQDQRIVNRYRDLVAMNDWPPSYQPNHESPLEAAEDLILHYVGTVLAGDLFNTAQGLYEAMEEDDQYCADMALREERRGDDWPW